MASTNQRGPSSAFQFFLSRICGSQIRIFIFNEMLMRLLPRFMSTHSACVHSGVNHFFMSTHSACVHNGVNHFFMSTHSACVHNGVNHFFMSTHSACVHSGVNHFFMSTHSACVHSGVNHFFMSTHSACVHNGVFTVVCSQWCEPFQRPPNKHSRPVALNVI